MNETVLVIDIGNTSTSAGLYRGGRIVRVGRLEQRSSSEARRLALLRDLTARQAIAAAVIASVVPRVDEAWADAARKAGAGRIVWLRHTTDIGLPITYPRPETIGADRLANACGGAIRHGLPLIVADFGTAVTFDIVTRREGYVGGIIAPGLPLMFDYLAEKTALLPHIGPGPVRHRIGKSTKEAMQLGAQWGYRGMARGILGELLKQPALRGAKLVATGGYAKWVVQGMKPRMILDQDLTLFGLGKVFELNERTMEAAAGTKPGRRR